MSLILNNDTIKIQSVTINKVGKSEDKSIYNVVLYLEFYSNNSVEPYTREPISIDGLSEKECNFKEYYKRLIELERFAWAEKN